MSVTFRSGSESYEQLTPDGDLGEPGLNEHFAENRATPSDDSDIYSQVDYHREEREKELMKSGDITNRLSGTRNCYSICFSHFKNTNLIKNECLNNVTKKGNRSIIVSTTKRVL